MSAIGPMNGLKIHVFVRWKMALTICPECSSNISDRCGACQNCCYQIENEAEKAKKVGNKKASTGVLVGCLNVVFVVAISLVLVTCSGPNEPPRTPEQAAQEKAERLVKDLKLHAFGICKKVVEQSLKAPATAEFSGFTWESVRKRPMDVFEVRSYVDAQNSFGAQIRTNFSCRLHYRGGNSLDGNNWELMDSSIE